MRPVRARFIWCISAWDWPPFRSGICWPGATASTAPWRRPSSWSGIVSVAIFTLDYGQVWAFYVLFAIKGFCFGSFAYLPRAMLADVIDLDTLRTGDARTGGYFSIYGFTTKLTQSVGGLSLIALSLVGYQTAIGATNGPTELFWLGALYALVPTALFCFALYLCWTWPLTSAKHAQLHRLLRAQGSQPCTGSPTIPGTVVRR